MKYLTAALFLSCGLARADYGWNTTLSQELCSKACSSVWTQPQVSPDSQSFVLAEQKNGLTSLWKFTVAGKRALLYTGILKAWTLEAAPLLLGLDRHNTVFGYDVLKKKPLYTFAPTAFEITGVDVLFRGQVGVATISNPKVEGGVTLETFDLHTGKALELNPGFALNPSHNVIPLEANTNPTPRYPVLEQVKNDNLWVLLERTPQKTLWLEVRTFDPCGCLACGCNPNKP